MSDALTCFITDDRSEVRTLALFVGADLETARRRVLEDLRANPHHLAVEVCDEDAVMFVLRREDLAQDETLCAAESSERA
jgi:hypothetical protein